MDVDPTPPQTAAETIDHSTPSSTNLPPSPPETDTISNVRHSQEDDTEGIEGSAPVELEGMDMDQTGSSSSHASAIDKNNDVTTTANTDTMSSTPVDVATPQPKTSLSIKLRHPAYIQAVESSAASRASTPGSVTGTGGPKRRRSVPSHPFVLCGVHINHSSTYLTYTQRTTHTLVAECSNTSSCRSQNSRRTIITRPLLSAKPWLFMHRADSY